MLSEHAQSQQHPLESGKFGQSQLWYPDDPKNEGHRSVRQNVLKLLDGKKPQRPESSNGSPRQPNAELRRKVEQAAVELVEKHYVDLGYEIGDVQTDNVGWDLGAIAGDVSLQLEVKGLSGSDLTVELTPNEYKQANSDKYRNTYRLCVVRQALSDPKLDIFQFNPVSMAWENECGSKLAFELLTGARCRLL